MHTHSGWLTPKPFVIITVNNATYIGYRSESDPGTNVFYYFSISFGKRKNKTYTVSYSVTGLELYYRATIVQSTKRWYMNYILLYYVIYNVPLHHSTITFHESWMYVGLSFIVTWIYEIENMHYIHIHNKMCVFNLTNEYHCNKNNLH